MSSHEMSSDGRMIRGSAPASLRPRLGGGVPGVADWAWGHACARKRATRLGWKPIYLHSDLEEKTGEWPACWLVVDWPEGQTDPYHVYVAWLKQPPAKGRALRLSRGRWPIEQYFQRGKDDLGLDHYEGRSWRGFHHHATLCIAAYGFLVAERNRLSPSARIGNLGLPAPEPPAEFRPRGSPRSSRAA